MSILQLQFQGINVHGLWFVVFSCGLGLVDITHIRQGYFTGTGAIIWSPQSQWILLKSIRVTSLALGQSYDCPSISEITLRIWVGLGLVNLTHILRGYSYDCPSASEVTLRIRVGLGLVNLTHILQGYFTDTGAIIWLPQCQWSNPEGYG